MQDITKHYLISGRVQGVGFRAFALHKAGELGLRGWVRNLRDGRVEVVGQGTAEMLSLFEAQLKSGPTHGEVEALTVEDWMSSANHEEFTFKKDGSEPCFEK